jgi:hypothetical protein
VETTFVELGNETVRQQVWPKTALVIVGLPVLAAKGDAKFG